VRARARERESERASEGERERLERGTAKVSAREREDIDTYVCARKAHINLPAQESFNAACGFSILFTVLTLGALGCTKV